MNTGESLQGEVGDKTMEPGENKNEGTYGSLSQEIPSAETEVGTLDNPSPMGANPSLPGFTENNLDEHWESHKKEYPGLTKTQYAQRAHDLVRSATNESILGFKSKNGSIARYDKDTGDFVQGFSKGIATMFKLRGGVNRFNKKKQRAEVES